MTKKQVVSASAALMVLVASCGGSSAGTSTAGFSDRLASVCRTIGRGIGNLDAATSLDDVRSNASEASTLYEDGLNELKKLTIPTSDQAFAADVKDLIASYEDQLDTLDAIAKAAKAQDQETVDSKIGKLSDQAADSNDLGDSLGITRCQLDPVFETTTPTTEPDVPLTLPIATVPETFPVETFPIDTTPFDTLPVSGNKTILSGSDIVPLGDYTFTDTSDTSVTAFQSLLDAAPSMAAQSGTISGVDVIDPTGQPMGRVFAFESDTDPLTPGSLDEVTPHLTDNIPTTPLTIDGLNGVTWSDSDGTTYFLIGVSNVLLWALAPTADLLEPAVHALLESLPQ